jgi:hypothetical protein
MHGVQISPESHPSVLKNCFWSIARQSLRQTPLYVELSTWIFPEQGLPLKFWESISVGKQRLPASGQAARLFT